MNVSPRQIGTVIVAMLTSMINQGLMTITMSGNAQYVAIKTVFHQIPSMNRRKNIVTLINKKESHNETCF